MRPAGRVSLALEHSGAHWKVQEVSMATREHARCKCCHQPFVRVARTNQYTVSDGSSVTAPNPDLCDECRPHQGSSVEHQLRKHKAHEQKLTESLYAADKYARDAQQKIKDARQQTAAALKSRERMAQALKTVQDLHTLRPNGSCTCGVTKTCRTADVIADNRWLLRMRDRVPLLDEDDAGLLNRSDETFDDAAEWMGIGSRGSREAGRSRPA